MTEPHTTPTETARPAESNVWPGTPTGRLACYACKRRKVKCDRQLPICFLCHKHNVVCEYPSHPLKPGPKTGTIAARQGAKRRRLDAQPGASDSSRDISFQVLGEAASSDHARRTSTASSASRGSPSQDGPLQRGGTAVPEGGLVMPSAGSRPSAQPTSAPIFSRIMYPSHEAQTRPQSPSTAHSPPPGHRHGASEITVQSVCDALGISRTTYDMLMDSYFTNMTSFSLFRPGSIEPKFAVMQYHSDAEALVAAMFSFSARHCRNSNAATMDRPSDFPSPSHFAQIASSQLDKSIDRYGDLRPPFWLLQAGILVTFYQLTLSVRSRSWKKLGDCIRYSYDTNLHIVDANHETASNTVRGTPDMQRWILLEERRRAWWAVWEMDVFASTIRRLPTAIDASQNLTLLPVPDSCWFNGIYQESCFLAEDCSLRWKQLVKSGNQSAKAWFIVVNSLMRNTQRIVYPAGSVMQSVNDKHVETNHDELNIMANCLYCTTTSLPTNLSYLGETLDFRPKSSPRERASVSPRQEHADKYALHLMTQLCRFMIYHHKICARAPWLAQQQKDAADGDDSGPSARQASSEWSNYMDASDEIVSVVRNSARDHYRYVNPFLANTLWFAAAAQCACKVFGPPSFNKRLTSSNLDLLKLTIDSFISFWGGMESLKGKLARIESGLQNLMARPGGHGSGDSRDSASEQRPREGQPAAQPSSTHDLAKRSTAVAQIPADLDVPSQDRTVPGTEPLLTVPGVAPNGWADPKWSTFVPVDLCDFTQPFAMVGNDTYGPTPVDFSPFGLEELLMAGMESHI